MSFSSRAEAEELSPKNQQGTLENIEDKGSIA
jgi:hypothetical protein